MKAILLLTLMAMIVGPMAWTGCAQDDQSGVIISGRDKEKIKGDKTGRDKSKPVRRAIEAWYDANKAAFEAKDVAAIMALRTDDFHTLTPDGKVNSRADMESRTRDLVGRIDHFISQEFEIGTIEIHNGVASAYVRQDTVRMQRFPDGTLHKVESRAKQRESWKQTGDGWKLYLVDDIHDLGIWVDGEPFRR
ncbi:MAG TPA: nuclear transport factor 2 family protein [Terriglobales bacterium]|nr:nuclear transport factor 2 family protein [Terriglobales bacterium]